MGDAKTSFSQIGILALAVILAGGGLVVDLFSDGEAPVAIESEAERSPAAIAATRTLVPTAVTEILRAGIGCSEKEKPLEVSSAQLRWSGRLCWSHSRLEDLEVVNENNRFSATLFAADGAKFETDLIPLELGVNRLRVRSKSEKDSRKEQVILVTRFQKN